MRNRLKIGVATVLAFTLWGCVRTPAKVVSTPPPPSIPAGPVMVSVPPPTHRSTSFSVETTSAANIPVVQPVPQPKKKQRRSNTVIAAATPSPAAAAPVQLSPPAHPVQSLGKLTAETDNPSAARAESEQALRTQLERINTLPSRTQVAHPAEVEQARRFLKDAADSWKAADYADSSALVTKAKVLLDDLLK